ELTRGAEDAAEKKGYSIIICNSDNNETKEENYLYILQEKMVDGIIMTASEGSIKKSMEKFNIPMVLVDRDIDINKKVGRITVDNEQGAYNATSYLIKKGCKNIGFISSDNKNKPSAERLKGYKNSLLDNGLKIEDEKIFLKRYTIDSGYMGAITLLKQSKIDGLCCGNDLIAIGAIKALKEKKIKVPEEVRVI